MTKNLGYWVDLRLGDFEYEYSKHKKRCPACGTLKRSFICIRCNAEPCYFYECKTIISNGNVCKFHFYNLLSCQKSEKST